MTDIPTWGEYCYQDCVDALKEVDQRHEYHRMSQELYNELRDESHPSARTIADYFESYTEARRQVLE